MKKDHPTINSSIDFTFHEINALNKLLGQIKSEASLNADELNFFALSPFIISAFEKIHRGFMDQIRHQVNSGKIQTLGKGKNFDSLNDFLMTEEHSIVDQKKRINALGESGRSYIKKMNETEREEYCDLIFAPFKPTAEQKQEIISLLKSLATEK